MNVESPAYGVFKFTQNGWSRELPSPSAFYSTTCSSSTCLFSGVSMEEPRPVGGGFEMETQKLACSFLWVVEGWESWMSSMWTPDCSILVSTQILQVLGFWRRTILLILSQMHTKCSSFYTQEHSHRPTYVSTYIIWTLVNPHAHTPSLQQKWPKLREVHMSWEMISFACFKSALVCTACSSKFTLQKADSFFHILFT